MLSTRRRPTAAAILALTALGVAAAPAAAAAPAIHEIDAELQPGGRLELSTETAGATRVTFSWAGRTAKGYLTEVDREEGTRDFKRTLAARGLKSGRHAITVRACGADGCTSRTQRVYVEFDD